MWVYSVPQTIKWICCIACIIIPQLNWKSITEKRLFTSWKDYSMGLFTSQTGSSRHHGYLPGTEAWRHIDCNITIRVTSCNCPTISGCIDFRTFAYLNKIICFLLSPYLALYGPLGPIIYQIASPFPDLPRQIKCIELRIWCGLKKCLPKLGYFVVYSNSRYGQSIVFFICSEIKEDTF